MSARAAAHQHHKILLLLIILVIVRGIIYISITPPWLAPDEATHFEAIRLMGQEEVQPTMQVYAVTPMHPDMPASFDRFNIWQISGLAPPQNFFVIDGALTMPYAHYYPRHNGGSVIDADRYPLLYHRLLAPLSGQLEALEITQQLYVLRLASLLFTVLTIICAWYLARTIFPDQLGYALGPVTLLIFLPMHLHINTSLNSDVLATLFVSAYFLALAQIFCRGVTLLRILLAGLLLLLAIMTKPTALFILPTTAAAGVVYAARRFSWNRAFLAVALVAVTVVTAVGGVLLFQGGDGGRALSRLELFSGPFDAPTDYFDLAAMNVYLYTVRWGFLSFWGLFGWANIALKNVFLIRALWLICAVSALGVALFYAKHMVPAKYKSATLTGSQKDILLVLLFGLIFALIGVYTPIVATQSIEWGPQSRYFFPALLPFSLYFFLGLQQLVPAKFHQIMLPVWLLALISFDSFNIAYVLIPRIYG